MYRYVILLGLFFSSALGQDILEKENNYLKLQSEKQSAEEQLDSLNLSLDKMLTKIDQAKLKKQDEDKTAKLMSGAFSISKVIEEKEEQIKALNDSIVKLEKELNSMYSKRIALLEQQLDNDITEQEKEELERELILLAEKKISVFPLFRNFNFNPEKINEIELSEVQNNFEKEILLDYLKSALTQVDSNLTVIEKKQEELEDNRRLEEKAELFMDDVANSRILGFQESTSEKKEVEDPLGRYEEWNNVLTNGDEWNYIQDNALANTMNFLSQLEYMGMPPDERINRYKISTQTPVTSEEYLEMLKSSKQFLIIYRRMLLKKITDK